MPRIRGMVPVEKLRKTIKRKRRNRNWRNIKS
jgi:hypothetical protein